MRKDIDSHKKDLLNVLRNAQDGNIDAMQLPEDIINELDEKERLELKDKLQQMVERNKLQRVIS